MDEPRREGPTRAQVEQVAGVAEKLAGAQTLRSAVDMGECRVRPDEGCATIACHAAWYVVGVTDLEGGRPRQGRRQGLRVGRAGQEDMAPVPARRRRPERSDGRASGRTRA